MLQPQIVDYAKSQLKLGIAREAIKSALLGAGWPEADIEESLTAAEEGEKKPEIKPEQKPEARPVFVEAKESAPHVVSPQSLMEKKDVIRVSDLVSSINSKLEIAKPAEIKKTFEEKAKETVGKKEDSGPAKLELGNVAKPPKLGKSLILIILLGVLALGFAGAGGWLYLQNRNLNSELGALKGEAGTSSARIAELEAQVGNLQAGLDNLNKEKQQLALELEFFAIPPGVSTGTEKTFANLKGVLGGGGKAPYTITTPLGSVLNIKNSAEQNAKAALSPLVGQEITISGSYLPGSRQITLSEINGSPIAPQAAGE